jgi:hypothetical protein
MKAMIEVKNFNMLISKVISRHGSDRQAAVHV